MILCVENVRACKMLNEYYSLNDVFIIDIYGLIYHFRLLKRA